MSELYDEAEYSLDLGRPTFCYQFVRVGHTFTDWSWYKITNRPRAVAGGIGNYLPEAVTHTNIKQTKDIDKNTVTITVPISNVYFQSLRDYSFDYTINITINRGHMREHSLALVPYWRGRISEVSAGNGKFIIKCSSIFTRLTQIGLRRKFQRGCPHPLYNVGCNLNKDDFVTTGTCTGISNNVLQVSGISALPAGHLDGGIVRFDEEHRMIEESDTTSVTVTRTMDDLDEAIGLSGSQSIDLYPGCDRSMATCDSKFSNILNFGGTPYIPERNPLGGTSII